MPPIQALEIRMALPVRLLSSISTSIIRTVRSTAPTCQQWGNFTVPLFLVQASMSPQRILRAPNILTRIRIAITSSPHRVRGVAVAVHGYGCTRHSCKLIAWQRGTWIPSSRVSQELAVRLTELSAALLSRLQSSVYTRKADVGP